MTNYIMPFLIIICLGIIIVLLVNLWGAITDDDVKKAAYMHIVDGSAEMKTWGTDDFFNISTDALIMQGDEIVTSADAKIIIEFFDGTVMRVDGSTDVNFVEIDDENEPPKMNLLLVNGRAWFNKLYRDTGSTYITVRTTNLEVVSKTGSIFEVENVMDEVVRVFSGNTNDIDVNIYNKDGSKVIETETIGIGQEVVFSDAVLDRYWQFQSPSVIAAVSDEFKQIDWYLWNVAEDKTPTVFEKSVDGSQFVKVEPEAVTLEGGEAASVEGAATMEPVTPEAVTAGEIVAEGQSAEAEKVETGALSAPTISSVAGVTTLNNDGYYVVSKNLATLTGGVSGDVASVVVNGYVLQKFKIGDKTWTYYANASYDLMKEGANSYEVHTVDANGNKSPSITVKVMYVPEKPVATVPTEPVSEGGVPEGGDGGAIPVPAGN